MKTVIQTRELGAEAYVLKHAPKSEVLQMLSDAFDNIAEASGGGATRPARRRPPACRRARSPQSLPP